MTPPDGLHVVLGASGGIGRALVRELARRGDRVRAVHRNARSDGLPDGVEALAVDISSAGGARTACAGAAVVHHCAQPAYHRWAREFGAMNEAVIAGAAAAGAKLVVADNLYMYSPPRGPLTEDAPQEPTSRKGAVRLAVANRLLDAHRAGVLRVAIGRASDYCGPGAPGTAAAFGPQPPTRYDDGIAATVDGYRLRNSRPAGATGSRPR